MSWEQLRPLLWYLLCIVVIIGLAYWTTRHLGTRGGLGLIGRDRRELRLEVLAQISLGREQQLVVVQAGTRYFLLGITGSSISNVAELTEEEVAAWRKRGEEQQAAAPPRDTFSQALARAIKHDKRG